MKRKAVIFDLDGTLLNTLSDIGDSMNRVLRANNLPEHPSSAYNYFVGEGAGRLVEMALPESERHQKDAFLNYFQEDYALHWDKKTVPYPGIPEMLGELQTNFLLCILSNKPDTFTQSCVTRYFPETPFAVVRGQEKGKPRKPDPFGVHEILKKTGLSLSDFIFIGDTKIDMLTAGSINMPCIGVTWGFRPQQELEENGATYIVHHPSEIVDILKLLASSS